MINDDVQLEVLHGRVEILFNGLVKAVDFVNEQDISLFQVGQDTRQVSDFFDRRAAGGFQSCAHLMSHDAGQGGLAQSGRATEKNVVENILTLLRSLNGYLQTILDLCLTGEIRKARWPQCHFQAFFGLDQAT